MDLLCLYIKYKKIKTGVGFKIFTALLKLLRFKMLRFIGDGALLALLQEITACCQVCIVCSLVPCSCT